MKATILTIGNELLSGRTQDTNFSFLARAFGEAGVRVTRHVTVGDERQEMLAALRAAWAESELVLVSGGLGPTADDLTREVVAEFAQVPLVEDSKIAARLEAVYARRGRLFAGVARRQALLPQGIETLPNPVGLAPGLWLEREGRVVCAMPGVPSELEAMSRESLLPRLRARAGAGKVVPAVTLRTLGISESDIAQRIEDDAIELRDVELAYLPQLAGVDLRVTGNGSDAAAALARVEAAIIERLGGNLYARGEETIEEVVNRQLRERGLKLAVAESCTGGLVAARVTRVPGSSDVFLGGLVAYANALKASELGVPEKLLEEHGAVSSEIATAMAEGALPRFGADVAVAVTGIAGPGGGSDTKPVGLVFIGLARRGAASESRRLQLLGDRHQIRERAAILALDCVRRSLLGIS